MPSMVKVTGVNEIRLALHKADTQLAKDMRRGLAKAGLLLRRYSMEVVPVDTTTLQTSSGTRVLGHGWNTDVIVFYTASYAVYVHERTDLKHEPGKQAKFLEEPARTHRQELLNVIAAEAGRGGGAVSVGSGAALPGVGSGAGASTGGHSGTGRRWKNQYGEGFVD